MGTVKACNQSWPLSWCASQSWLHVPNSPNLMTSFTSWQVNLLIRDFVKILWLWLPHSSYFYPACIYTLCPPIWHKFNVIVTSIRISLNNSATSKARGHETDFEISGLDKHVILHTKPSLSYLPISPQFLEMRNSHIARIMSRRKQQANRESNYNLCNICWKLNSAWKTDELI